MKQIIFFFLLLAINTNFLLAQNNVWKELSQNELSADPQSIQRNYLPEKYKLFQTDHAALRQALQNAASTGVPIALPLPDGGMADFKVSNYSVMSPALASKFPDFNTYTIESIDATNPLNGRVGITPEGFHAVYLTDHGLAFVLPFAKRQLKFYMSYYDTDCKDFNGNTLQFTCGNTDNEDIHTPHNIGALETLHNNHSSVRTNSAALEEKRTYRMAMACTGEYANQNGGTVSSVINSFVLFTNTINLIYERDLSIKFELIDNEEALVFLNPNTDPYHDSNVGSLLIGQNTTIINQNVGAQNYDVGHVMTATCSDVGGIASPSVICTGNKGNGVTCQYTDLETIALRVACHEIGHQFSASHTWANCPGILDQLVSDSAFEPGSGTTIMSYAGFCGAQNTQDSQYAYFHARSLEQIIDFSRNGNGNVCPTVIETTNHIPTITLNYPSNMYIPISTPFELNASVSDEDNNSMKYTWEQYDLDPGVHDLGMPLGDAPTFKNFDLSNNTNRYFPRLSQIISNSSDNIEVLPTYSRNLTFRFVARDMVAQQGAVAWEEVKFKSTGLAGPFLVQNPNTGSESWTSGNFQQVTWDVANTNNAPVNCKKVRLRLSIDGGNTYPYTLLSETDNDGAEYVVVPSDIATTNARVRIEGVNNVFFDISNSNFDIVAPTTPTYSLDYFPREASFCLPNSAEIIFSSNSILGFTEPIHLEIVEGLPDQAQATFTNSTINPGQNATLNLNFPANVPGGEFILKVRATAPGTDTTYREIKINTYSNDFSALTQQLPTDGAVGVNGLPTFQFNLSPNALTYDLQIATNPSFTSESIVHVKTNLTQNTYVPTVTLPINSTLYWRVRPINDCGEGSYLTPFAFHTESFTCTNYNAIGLPVFIGPIGTPTVMATIQIPQPGGVISDINVKKVKASHDYVGDIRLKLRSPSGSEVVLLNQRCANSTNLNLGFDDEAFYNIPCPLTLGLLYRPEEPLTLFDGQTTAGDWKLILEDLHSGSGGQLEEVRLEICSNVSTNGPSLLRNNPLSVRPSLTGYITNNFLEYQDSDSQPQELEFTIVKLPEHGVLKLAGNTLGVGDVFRQFSINAGNVTYTNNGDDATTDYFTFTVNDGQSGFVGTPRFDILIDPNAPVNTNEVTNSTKDIWMIYPNPTTDVLTIKNIGNNNETIDWISCYDAMGRLVGNWKLNDPSDNYTLNIRNLSEGSYYLKVCNSKHNVSIPFIKVNN